MWALALWGRKGNKHLLQQISLSLNSAILVDCWYGMGETGIVYMYLVIDDVSLCAMIVGLFQCVI